jgi:hypothetical protein
MKKLMRVLLVLLAAAVLSESQDYSVTSSLREMAGGAFLASWPVSERDKVAKQVSLSYKFANNNDAEDCAKKLLCELAGKRKESKSPMAWDEELLLEAFDAEEIDYTSASVQFQVAVKVGKKNESNCRDVYSRCSLDLQQMLKMLRRQGISFIIPGEERDCSIYFLWKNKEKSDKVVKEVSQNITTESIMQLEGDDLAH